MTKIKIFTQSKSKAAIEIQLNRGKTFIIDKERIPRMERIEVQG
jgi:hypothetical protein